MSLALLAFPTITRTDVWIAVLLSLLVTLAIKACRVQTPDPAKVQAFATISNTKGGIILILLGLWLFTLVITAIFSVWIIVRGVDPQHPVAITFLAMLTGTAFGNVNGALFKTMTGEDPKAPASIQQTTTTRIETPPVPPTPSEVAK